MLTSRGLSKSTELYRSVRLWDRTSAHFQDIRDIEQDIDSFHILYMIVVF